jgi:methionyl-tRNA formyltransferase
MQITLFANSDLLVAPALLSLRNAGHQVSLVIPAKSASILRPALQHGCGIEEDKVYEVRKAGISGQLTDILGRELPDVCVVLTFPWVIPDDVLSLPRFGFLNFHFGRLPAYGGADPIFWQLRNGEKSGGISVHKMTSVIDAGPPVFFDELPVIPGETYGIHAQRLGQLAASSVLKALEKLGLPTETSNTTPVQVAMTPAPGRDEITINWTGMSADEIERLVNACNPKYGGALTSIRGSQVSLLEVMPVDLQLPTPLTPGTIAYADAVYGLIVACKANQFLRINTVQMPEGYLSGPKLFALGFKTGERFLT